MTPPTALAAPASAASPARREAQGLAWGVLGVALFALTLPMTRLAVGAAEAPQLPPLFVTAGRAAGAGLLSAAWLWLVRAPWPARAHWLSLALTALGVVAGFPLCLALALRHVAATHAAVVTGVLPLATAALGALLLRQRASAGFWACALAGCALVLAYAGRGGDWRAADALLLLAVLAAAYGYVQGARLASALGPERVICWVLVLSLPLAAPLTLAAWPARPASTAAWAGFGYVTVCSMWLGFFAWYRGLALGGTLRVSQVQLLQPFLALLAAVPLLGERLDTATLGYALAIVGIVFLGRRMRA